MELERFRALTDAYGADERHWPASERAAMRALLGQSDEARQLLFAARELDLLLDSYQPVAGDLGDRIMEALPPPGIIEGLLAWLLPGGRGSILRPVTVAAMPLLLGLSLGIAVPADVGSSTTSWADWESEERILIAAEVNWYD